MCLLCTFSEYGNLLFSATETLNKMTNILQSTLLQLMLLFPQRSVIKKKRLTALLDMIKT